MESEFPNYHEEYVYRRANEGLFSDNAKRLVEASEPIVHLLNTLYPEKSDQVQEFLDAYEAMFAEKIVPR